MKYVSIDQMRLESQTVYMMEGFRTDNPSPSPAQIDGDRHNWNGSSDYPNYDGDNNYLFMDGHVSSYAWDRVDDGADDDNVTRNGDGYWVAMGGELNFGTFPVNP